MRFFFTNLVLVLGVVSLLFIGCNSPKKPKANSSIPPKFVITKEPEFVKQGVLSFFNNNKVITSIDFELADTYKKREQGLMYRRSMKQNRGMLFIFEKEERQSFWMKDTHIALDIIFVNEEKRIVHIAHDCSPYSLKSIPSFEYAKYVIEVNSGFCINNKIKEGIVVKF